MKRVILVAAVSMMALASCKKDYTCECTVTAGGSSATSSTVLENVSKSDAEDACISTSSYTVGTTTSTTTCDLK